MRNFLLILTLASSSVFAFEGGGSISGGTRGGGNSCGSDFAFIGKMVYQRVLHNDYFKNNVNLIALKDAIAQTSVRETTQPITDAENVKYEAANYPDDKIILVHQDYCNNRLTKPNAKLVFHEYLGIAAPGLDAGFNISGRLFSETGLTDKNFQNLLETNGSDASVLNLRDKELVTKNLKSNSVELNAKNGQFRLIVNCDIKHSELNYHKLSDSKVVYSTTFKFKSATQCQEVFGKALLNDEINDLDLVLGLESHTVISKN
ncbi:hypothetical protein ACJVC5_04145 [Peredibacter sp. HCB2-198]|uniref:hypothetical protein n=1 Tax=Peredibacter sp. HCB2-198 TaxID=3383025 RepID=UPI0038B60C6C